MHKLKDFYSTFLCFTLRYFGAYFNQCYIRNTCIKFFPWKVWQPCRMLFLTLENYLCLCIVCYIFTENIFQTQLFTHGYNEIIAQKIFIILFTTFTILLKTSLMAGGGGAWTKYIHLFYHCWQNQPASNQ